MLNILLILFAFVIAQFAAEPSVRAMALLRPGGPGGVTAICLACAGTVALFAIIGLIFRKIISSLLAARPHRKQETYSIARRFTSVYKGLMLFCYFFILSPLDWYSVSEIIAPPREIIFAHFLLKMLPFFALLLMSWLAYYGIERTFAFRTWTLSQYLSFQVRQTVVVMVPLLFFNFVVELVGTLKVIEEFLELYPELMVVSFIPMMAVIYTLIPILARFLWTVESFPKGYLRGRLEELCRRHGVRIRDILLWRTGRASVINAAVLGLFGRFRYVIITDGLLNNLSDSEVEAVFGHELGHARHHHIAVYACFLIVISFATMAVMAPIATGNGLIDGIMQIVITFGVFIGIVFGFISRRFERQADLFGCRVVGDTMTFVNALEKVALHSGNVRHLPSWMHSSIEKRVNFLMAAMHYPAIAESFQRRARSLALGIVAAFLACLALVGVRFIAEPYGERLLEQARRYEGVLSRARGEQERAHLRVRLAAIYERAGEYRRAAAHYDAFFENERLAEHLLMQAYGEDDKSSAARDLRDTGRLFLEKGFVDTAAQMIVMAVRFEQNNPENATLTRDLARACFGRLEAMLAEGARERSELDVSGIREEKPDRLLRRELERVLPVIRFAWSLSRADAELTRMLGRAHLMKGNYADAAHLLASLTQSSPETLAEAGTAFGFAGDIRGAEEMLFKRFRQAVLSAGERRALEEARRRVALRYSFTAPAADMRRTFALWGRLDASSPMFARYAAAEAMQTAGETETAAVFCLAAAGAFPENAFYRYRLGEIFLAEGRLAEACGQLERAALQGPPRRDYFEKAALALRAKGDRRAAVFEEIARMAPPAKGGSLPSGDGLAEVLGYVGDPLE